MAIIYQRVIFNSFKPKCISIRLPNSMESDPIDFAIDFEAVSNLDQQTAEHFAQTVNKLKGKVTILFITHQLPKGLQVDEAVVLGKAETMQANNYAALYNIKYFAL